jgi:hypothetical protein
LFFCRSGRFDHHREHDVERELEGALREVLTIARQVNETGFTQQHRVTETFFASGRGGFAFVQEGELCVDA